METNLHIRIYLSSLPSWINLHINVDYRTRGIKINIKIMETKRLYRSRNPKMIGGVCAGIAKYFNMDGSFLNIG